MNHICNLGAATFLVMCSTVPALVQTATNPPPNSGTASISASTPSERNPVLADNGDARTSKVVGSDVHNEQDKKLGSVDDILLGPGGADPKAVLSVEGKLVEVPYGKLEFGDTKQSSHNRVILRGETVDSLKKRAVFNYRKG
jgi:PRC-barrel domain